MMRVDNNLYSFNVSVRSDMTVGENAIRDLIQKRHEVVYIEQTGQVPSMRITSFRVTIRSMNIHIGPHTITELIQAKHEVMTCEATFWEPIMVEMQ